MSDEKFDEKESFAWKSVIRGKDNLRNYLGCFDEPDRDELFRLMKENDVIIAGGSALSALHDEKINDIDIYAHAHGAKKVVFFIMENAITDIKKFNSHVAPAYDESFLRANNIKVRIHLELKNRGKNQKKYRFDIMIVDDAVNLSDVVSNFDLTFCQTWFDGENFMAMFPSDIEYKSGRLTDQYIKSLMNFNKFTINRIKKYKDKGYKIVYNTGPNYCDKEVYIEKTKTPVSMEEWIVKMLYDLFLNELQVYCIVRSLIPKYEMFFDLLLLDYTYDSFFAFMNKIVKEGCYVPEWIIYLYRDNKEEIIKTTLLWLLRKIKSDPFGIKKEYADYISEFCNEKLGISDMNKDSYEKWLENIRPKLRKFNSIQILTNYYSDFKELCIKKKQYKNLKKDWLKLRGKTRSIKELNSFVNPFDISTKSYPEMQLVQDETKGRCKDLYTMGLNNINAYLRGERVEALTADGQRPDEDEREDYDLEPVSPEEARKRLVFFVETSPNEYTPVCYNLDMIENADVKTSVFSTTCGASGSLANIFQGLSNPLFKIDIGDFPVFVYLKELLGALYKTKKQVFILSRPDPQINYERTASLDVALGTAGSMVSGDHCQEGTNKTVYTISVCEEKDGNLCYPIIEDNEIDVFDLDVEDDMPDRKIQKIKKLFKLGKDIKDLEYNVDYQRQHILESGRDIYYNVDVDDVSDSDSDSGSDSDSDSDSD